MSTLVLLKMAEKCLPGFIERETVYGYRTAKKIDWLVTYEKKTYIDVAKMKFWARKNGKLIPPDFAETEKSWGFEVVLEQEHAGSVQD